MKQIEDARKALEEEFAKLEDKRAILRSVHIRALFEAIREVDADKRAEYGQALNRLKNELQEWIDNQEESIEVSLPIDVSAPWDVNISSDQDQNS